MVRKLLFLAIVLCLLLLPAATRPAAAQGQNLLQNPSFEGGYAAYTPRTAQEHADCPTGICNTVQIPSGWYPWWVKEKSSDANPEYKQATAPFANRVRSGASAAQYFTFYRTHKAGFFQQVTVPTNALVQFTAWGQTWISNGDGLTSDGGAQINMRVGIDPYGGTDPYSGNIVWSATQNPYDAYYQFAVQAQAQGNRVTVFLYSAPPYAHKHNDVYWDDAALVVVGQGAAPPPPAPAPPPAGDVHVVKPGESLSGIARMYGVDMFELAALNNIADPNLIHSGQILQLPGGTGGGSTPPPAAGVQATTVANLRLRSGPDTAFPILDVAPYGTVLPVLGRNSSGTWIQVSYQGKTGWMASWYVTLSGGTLADLPVL